MTELLTAAQMRAVEAAAIASGEVTGLELMERAGRGVVEAIFEDWPELRATSHRAVVLCGPGNNGGDGFVVARLLQEWGWEVEVFLYGDPEKMPPDARVNYERWVGMGEVVPLENYGALPVVGNNAALGPMPPYDPLVVDAVFGIGCVRPTEGQLAEVLDHVNHIAQYERTKVVAIDLPSGLCSDSGSGIGETAGANLTVTFHRQKVGQWLGDGPIHCGRLRVCDIGLASFRVKGVAEDGTEVLERLRDGEELEDADWRILKGGVRLVNRPRLPWKWSQGHKYSHGHALILSGPSGRGGAARLAARGSLRIGAGVVTVGCPPDAIPEHAARLDAVMLRGVADGEALAGVLEDWRINALCVGPGLGVGDREAGLVGVALGSRGEPRPTGPVGRGSLRLVLDADALTILSHHADLFAALHDGCVLTPHAGEFARLFPDIAEKLAAPATKGPAYSKVDATREAAKQAGCVVLYKGPDTVIADPTGHCAINSAHYHRAAPWLATAGSGDVLAGFITGLMARGSSPFDAACTGAWLHVECALSFGPGLIAEDLPEELPKVFRALGL
ncbi:NAD(P)H-hydrate dehydratase [Tabrizicola sp.]|uniref:NAD(P)H-hydrate dehydratase n=1 Tax=Tabrizicola sp. TaxID=2005166 RepID=UPI002733FD15|nr:NAD(P)H-hydrate dehydratase [Tabrizicola sp.]MDP3196824.1 NAD(P)H-hydrate dehydratase [Tabrizicola sp.]